MEKVLCFFGAIDLFMRALERPDKPPYELFSELIRDAGKAADSVAGQG